ncbi:MAG TPA: hypothetical protein DD435_14865 [Cyanobacteria bacterium UBA8530]|nr:hypothetical protein [Cyanobacteria bacterium UBA8530]
MATRKVCPICGEKRTRGNDHHSCIENDRLIARLWSDQPTLRTLRTLLDITRSFEPVNSGL